MGYEGHVVGLTEAMERLEAAVKELRKPAAELKAARDALKPVLEAHPDARAATDVQDAPARVAVEVDEFEQVAVVDIDKSGNNNVLSIGTGGDAALFEIKGNGLSEKTRIWTGSDFNGVNAPTSLENVQVEVV